MMVAAGARTHKVDPGLAFEAGFKSGLHGFRLWAKKSKQIKMSDDEDSDDEDSEDDHAPNETPKIMVKRRGKRFRQTRDANAMAMDASLLEEEDDPNAINRSKMTQIMDSDTDEESSKRMNDAAKPKPKATNPKTPNARY